MNLASGKPTGRNGMKINGKTLLLCDCEGSMPLDGKALGRARGGAAPFEDVPVHSQLCRAQLGEFQRASLGEGPVLVACTQEAPLFAEVIEDGNPNAEVAFVNIRERAGWADEAGAAMPKIAALLAEAAIDIPPARAMTIESAGVALVYGRDETAIDRKSTRLNSSHIPLARMPSSA